jgi:hypothetical protein
LQKLIIFYGLLSVESLNMGDQGHIEVSTNERSAVIFPNSPERKASARALALRKGLGTSVSPKMERKDKDAPHIYSDDQVEEIDIIYIPRSTQE